MSLREKWTSHWTRIMDQNWTWQTELRTSSNETDKRGHSTRGAQRNTAAGPVFLLGSDFSLCRRLIRMVAELKAPVNLSTAASHRVTICYLLYFTSVIRFHYFYYYGYCSILYFCNYTLDTENLFFYLITTRLYFWRDLSLDDPLSTTSYKTKKIWSLESSEYHYF